MSGFKLQRLGIVMEPEPGNPQEIEGVLNPAEECLPWVEFTTKALGLKYYGES